MQRPTAVAGSALFFAIAPGVVAGLVPWWLTRWRVRGPLAHWAPVRAAGLTMLILGAIVLVQAFARFVAEGHGTPAPPRRPPRCCRAPGGRRPWAADGPGAPPGLRVPGPAV